MPAVLALIETLIDIIRLRKGPDAIPHSTFLLVVIIALWLFAGLLMTFLTAELDEQDFVIGTMALLGCGALLSLMFVAGNVFLTPFLSENITNFIVTLILLWTVPVEGHIISRTLDRHWYIGVAIAMAVFVFQLILYSVMNPVTTAPG